jgi:N-methylhydantoinase A/oxoprolinase/acetone carboxylase beta subunit
MSSPLLQIDSDDDAESVYQAFEDEFSASFSPLVVNKPGGVYLDNFILRATVPTRKPDLPEFPLKGEDASGAKTGSRKAYWPEIKEHADTPIYAFERLQPGNRIQGPAIVEAELTTVVIPPKSAFSIDKHGLGILESLEPPRVSRSARQIPATAK